MRHTNVRCENAHSTSDAVTDFSDSWCRCKPPMMPAIALSATISFRKGREHNRRILHSYSKPPEQRGSKGEQLCSVSKEIQSRGNCARMLIIIDQRRTDNRFAAGCSGDDHEDTPTGGRMRGTRSSRLSPYTNRFRLGVLSAANNCAV